MTTAIQIAEARRQLGELINEAYYTGKRFQLAKGNKPMAVLVGTKEFAKMLEIIEAHDPGLADTLAIMSNPEAQEVIAAGEGDIKNGNLIPLEDALK
jgi:prevent-host-death family protein